jgi:hypothetical protein
LTAVGIEITDTPSGAQWSLARPPRGDAGAPTDTTTDTTTDTDTTVLRLRPPGEGTTLHAQIPLTTAHSTGLTFLPPPDGKADLHAPPSSPRPTTEA